MLLAEFSCFCKFIETKFVYEQWNKHKVAVTRTTCSPVVQILTAIGHLATTISRIAIEDMKGGCGCEGSGCGFSECSVCYIDDVVQLLTEFKMGPSVIQAAVNTLCLICSALNTKQNYQVLLLLAGTHFS